MNAQPTVTETHERTQFNDELHARVSAYIKENGLSIADFADLINYSRTTLSRYLAREYVTTKPVEAAIAAFFTRQERVATGGKFRPTALAREVVAACQYSLTFGAFVLVYAPAGAGKTTAALEFMRRKGRSAEGRSRVLFVTADPTMTTVSLLRRVGKEAGVYSYESRTHELLSNIVARLKQENCLLIVDEAPHLSVKSLHTLRHIHDQTACGLLLMGATVLMQRTFHAKGRAREDLEQILSRVDQVKYLPGAATETDLASIAIAHGIHQKWHSLILPHVQRPREMLKLCRHAMNLRQLNPDATPDDIVRKALNEVFQAA